MSARSNGVEWVETTEEVVITEECLSPVNNNPAVIPVLEPEETPIQRLLETVGQGDNPEADDGFYCKECLPLFQDQTDPANINGPSFILDFPTSMGVPQRALLTIPYGLMIGRSSIPGAGVGVINHGPTVSPGMHFGPYEGEVTTRENAVESDFSWEIYKGKEEYEYIDAARDSHSNWMRYVNCARNKDETNLLAVQYKGSILFHCCRTVLPGDELMVWPSSKLLDHFSEAWTQMWLMRLNATESCTAAALLCSHCQLTFTTESFLQRHTQHFHKQPTEDVTLPAAEATEPETPASTADCEEALVVLSVDPVVSHTCGDCGKVFKQMPHLRRHKLCVHSNKRPYCCPHCRRSFSQASGLIRHQLIHRKQVMFKETDAAADQNEREESSRSEHLNPADPPEEAKEVDITGVEENTSTREAETPQSICSDCGKGFTSDAYLRKHKLTVHKGLRPYVCTVCQKCFGQYSDLNRHLRRHQTPNKGGQKINQDPEEATETPFGCAECSLTFPSAESLLQHNHESHSEEATAGNQEDEQRLDPDFSPPKSAANESIQTLPSQRPQRLGARSKVSAITKLIAPKRRAANCKKLKNSSVQAESGSPETEEPPAKNGKLTKYKWFSCNRCKRTYGNQEDLKAHTCALRQHKCGQCGATFMKSSFLKRHEQTAHVNSKTFNCERCGKVFTTSANLKQHQKNNTCKKYHCTSQLFPCSFCQFSFTLKSYLIKHIKRHHPVEYLTLQDSESLVDELEEEEEEDKECECPHCGESFPSGKALKAHACFQQVKVLYLCTDCGKGFTNHYGLKQHQRVHTGEKPYSCPHCTKSFSYTGQLNVHLRTHTGEKPYLCTHCGESFRQSGDLKRHERKHTGVRPYSCPECRKSFSRPQSLKAHQMLHLGQRMFKCTQCGKSFSRNYHLRRHHQKMHL
ncbi:histone-lysine N-methyltransferase PRDM9-like [Notolabrus celidotus]|uniref:histone-lysine N-methyltransferase PRDM9-like n=1 Tax=Notolabrus celidotus TaxID=1203425 RepID=UPI0014908786|nr:histone-lysine N-methyltransferase PRDM9-like [Notolabrus celidotus]XP_034563226.1 histone-lysine N-methyltransferase PRDM9-like [Notolabrus celidotus]